MAKKTQKKSVDLVVKTNTVIGTQYSQFVGMTVTDFELTLEFVYINPRDETKGEVVSRVTLPVNSAEKLSKTILKTVKQHKNKKKGKNA